MVTFEKRPYEAYFVVLVALTSAGSGFCGYLSMDATSDASSASTESLRAQSNASDEFTLISQAVFDDSRKLTDANVHWLYGIHYEEYNDTFNASEEYDVAYYLYTDTEFHLRYDTNETYWDLFNSTNESDMIAFWKAFNHWVQTELVPYHEMKNESERMALEAVQLSQQSKFYLISTVLFGISAAVSAAGLSVDSKGLRLFLLAVTVLVILLAASRAIMQAM